MGIRARGPSRYSRAGVVARIWADAQLPLRGAQRLMHFGGVLGGFALLSLIHKWADVNTH